jgi:hypothetical protein
MEREKSKKLFGFSSLLPDGSPDVAREVSIYQEPVRKLTFYLAMRIDFLHSCS